MLEKKMCALLLFLVAPILFATPSTVSELRLSSGIDGHFRVQTEGGLLPTLIAPGKAMIGVSGQASSESVLFGPEWASEIDIHLTDDRGREWRLQLVSPGKESVMPHPERPNVAPGRWATALFSAESLPVGTYHVTAAWRGTTSKSMFMVVRGDETPQIQDFALQEQLEHVTAYDDIKRLQLKRLELNPDNVLALMALAQVAEAYAPMEETAGYYRQAIAICARSEKPDVKGIGSHLTRILELLPAYYADRDHLMIEKYDEMAHPRARLVRRPEPRPKKDSNRQ